MEFNRKTEIVIELKLMERKDVTRILNTRGRTDNRNKPTGEI